MKFRSGSAALLLAIVLLTISAVPLPAGAVKGPRSDGLILYYHAGVGSAYAALKAGQIDAVGDELTPDLYANATADPTIVVAPVADAGFYEVDVNNNWTIQDDPGVRSPTTYLGFRQALAWLTNKTWVVDEACGSFAERIDQMIAAPYKAWANATMWYPYYPYEYNSSAAAAALDAANFTQGETPNPYYDPTFPGSANYMRTYPTGHPLAGEDLHPLVACVITDDIRRLEAGRHLVANMRKHGIPVEPLEDPAYLLYDRVMRYRNYHIYTGGWSGGRFPAITLYALYHSGGWYPYGPNYVTGTNATGDPNYPHLDALLEAARFPDTYEEAVAATKLAAGYMTELCINIPLFSTKAYWAWSTNLLGLVNMKGAGLENGYSFMNAYKALTAPEAPIRYGLTRPPLAVNIFYSSWPSDYSNLDRMNLAGGVDVPPYDLAVDQAGFVKERLVSTWNDDGVNKTKVTYTYRPDAYFAAPVTGHPLERVNASHIYASIWYDYQLGDGWFYTDVANVDHLNLTGPSTLEIYFDSYSYWHAYAAQPSIKSFHLLQQGTLSNYWSEDFTDATADAYLGLSHKVYWVTSIYDDLGPLVPGTEWEIYVDGHGGYADVYILAGVTITGTVHVDYWSAEDATGFTPGNLPWQIAFEGAGAWYATGFNPEVGGNLTLEANRFYYMETPLLGEVDWVRKPNGCYKIDIYDVVIAAGAYGSQGTGVPSPHWFAGADLAIPGGKVDIFDITTITTKYGQEFDCDP